MKVANWKNDTRRYSVIIPTYNRAGFLQKAVDSVLAQSFKDFELIIIDDGSSDKTAALVKSYGDTRIKYIYQNNGGVSSARNRALKESSGEYIAFLDSDDWWMKDKLISIEDAIINHPEYFIYHTEERWFRNGKLLNQKKKHRKPSGDIFKTCLKLCCVSISCAVVKSDLFNDIGLFDESLPVCEDYDFWLRASVRYPVYLIDKVLTEKEGGHPDQQSQKFKGMDKFRITAITNLIDNVELDNEKYSASLDELKKKCTIYANGCFKRGRVEEGCEALRKTTIVCRFLA